MKISMIVPSNSQGLKDYSYGLVSNIYKYNKDVEIVCNENFEYNIEGVQVNKLFSSGKYSILNGLKFIKYLFVTDSDILHLQSPNMILILLLILMSKFRDFKIVITPHSVIPHWKRPVYEKLKCAFWSSFNLTIIHTNSDKKYVNNKCTQTLNLEVIPHGSYDFLLNNSETVQVAEMQSIDKDKINFLFFGYIRDDKNLPLLLEALELLDDNDKNKINLIVAGRNKSSFDIKEYLKNSNSPVTYIDRFISNEEIGYIFKNSDVVTLPYNSISESGILHIAFSQGLPILATKIDGFEERITSGFNGLLFDLNAKSIKDKMIEFINNKREIQANSNMFITEYLDKYSWDSIAKKTITAYKDIL
jgi:glycosyltransferase involved in cell wall biosynthesis